MNDIPIIVLAAGQSRRMGGTDKLMQLVDGHPLLRRSARIARAAGPVIVALPPAPHPRHDALTDLDVYIVDVPDASEGMNASLRRAIRAVPKDVPAAMILLADMPELTSQDLKTVMRAVDEAPDRRIWRGTTVDGQPGHPVIFHRSLFGELLQLTGDGGAQPVIKRHADETCLVRLPEQHARLDLDTPEAWRAWRSANENRLAKKG